MKSENTNLFIFPEWKTEIYVILKNENTNLFLLPEWKNEIYVILKNENKFVFSLFKITWISVFNAEKLMEFFLLFIFFEKWKYKFIYIPGMKKWNLCYFEKWKYKFIFIAGMKKWNLCYFEKWKYKFIFIFFNKISDLFYFLYSYLSRPKSMSFEYYLWNSKKYSVFSVIPLRLIKGIRLRFNDG